MHIIHIPDGKIVAVFNDGRLYKKPDIFNTIWEGPIKHSLPNDVIPLRMITLSPSLDTLYGIGYDNRLYMKPPDDNNTLQLSALWQLVPNNINIIYIIFDNENGNMISIDINGMLFIKASPDISSNNTELQTQLDRPILRLYYDLNGYMLVIDTQFKLYQFTELNWKNSALNLTRGSNASNIQDILYHTDGKLFGLIFNPKTNMLQIMKQEQSYYLSDFIAFDKHLSLENNNEFVMTVQDIIKAKIGNINKYLEEHNIINLADDDPNIAYQKQIIDTRTQLKQFCANRNTSVSVDHKNYDLLASVDKNANKIDNLKTIINTLLTYEPDKEKIIDKYPIINAQ